MTYGSVATQLFTTPAFNPTKHLTSLVGKVALITGASTGLGKITATELAKKGAHVFCLGRSKEKTEAAVESIIKESGNDNVEFIQADLMDLKSVLAAANSFISRGSPLHILVNNAGIMAVPYALSKDGIESQFATNHFSHVVLTNALLPILIASQPSRIVNLSSLAHTRAPLDGIHYSQLLSEESYHPQSRYAETKLANIHFTRLLQKKLQMLARSQGKECKVYVNAVHPGIVKTELSRNFAKNKDVMTNETMLKIVSIDAFRGALTQIYVAASPEIEKESSFGNYFVPYCTMAEPTLCGKSDEMALQTWNWTETVLKEKFDSDWEWVI